MVGAKKKRPSANTQLPPLDVVVGVWLRCRKTKKVLKPKRGLKTSSSLFAQYLFVPASAFITLVARRCQEKNRTLVVEASTVRWNLGKELTPEKDSHRFTILFAHSRFYANEIAR